MNVGKFAAQKTAEKSSILCADLSAATDRFPREIQRALLFELIKDNDLATALWTILADRTFTVAWSREKVTYNCGQPMGAYGSWPLFALAHHLVVEYCSYCCNIKQSEIKHLYRVIGDDVIITQEETAQKYLDIMQRLGVTINKGKTVWSPPSQPHSCAEVAKQLYLNGTTLSPLTPGFVKDLRKPYMFNTCMQVLRDRYDFISPEVIPMLIDLLFLKQQRKLVWLLSSDPIDGVIKPGMPGYDNQSPWIGFDPEVALNLKHDFQVEAIMNSTISFGLDIGRGFNQRGDPWVGQSQTQNQAITKVNNDLKKELDALVQKFQFSMGQMDDGQSEIAYIPDPEQPFRSRRELKSQRLSRLKVDIYNQMKEWQ
jgi:hypothetical protein